MDNVLQKLNRIFFPAVKDTEESPLPTVEEELITLKNRIEAAQTRFNTAVTDGEIEAAVYDLNALEVRYRLLLRKKKSREV